VISSKLVNTFPEIQTSATTTLIPSAPEVLGALRDDAPMQVPLGLEMERTGERDFCPGDSMVQRLCFQLI